MTGEHNEITLRPLERADEDAIMAFSRGLPDHDLLFVARDLTQPRVLKAWLDAIERGRIHSDVAIADGRIAGYNALVSDPLSWSPHVGEIRIMVGPDHRRRAVGRLLAQAAFDKAMELGLQKVVAQMTVDQHGAIALFEDMGFRGEALLRDHVRTRDGETFDLAVLSYSVGDAASRRSAFGIDR